MVSTASCRVCGRTKKHTSNEHAKQIFFIRILQDEENSLLAVLFTERCIFIDTRSYYDKNLPTCYEWLLLIFSLDFYIQSCVSEDNAGRIERFKFLNPRMSSGRDLILSAVSASISLLIYR